MEASLPHEFEWLVPSQSQMFGAKWMVIRPLKLNLTYVKNRSECVQTKTDLSVTLRDWIFLYTRHESHVTDGVSLNQGRNQKFKKGVVFGPEPPCSKQ